MKIGDRVRYQGRTGKVTAFMPGDMVDVRFEGASYDERKAKNLLEVVKGDVAKKNGGRLRPLRRVRRNPAEPLDVPQEVDTRLKADIEYARRMIKERPGYTVQAPDAISSTGYDLSAVKLSPYYVEAYRDQLYRILSFVEGDNLVGVQKKNQDEVLTAFAERLPSDKTLTLASAKLSRIKATASRPSGQFKVSTAQYIDYLKERVLKPRLSFTKVLMDAYKAKNPEQIASAQREYASRFPTWLDQGVARPDPVLLENLFLKGHYASLVFDNLVKAYEYEAFNIASNQTTFEDAVSRLVVFVNQIRQVFGCTAKTTQDCLRGWTDFAVDLKKFAVSPSASIPGASGPMGFTPEPGRRRGKAPREQKVQKVSYFKKKEVLSREPKSALDELLKTSVGGFFTRHDPFRPANWDEILPPGFAQMTPEERADAVDTDLLASYRPESCGNPIDGTAYYMTLGSQPYKMSRYITWFDAIREDRSKPGNVRRVHAGVVKQTADGDFLIGPDIPVRYQVMTGNPLDARKKRWPEEVLEFEAALFPAADLSYVEMVEKIDEALSPSQEDKVRAELKQVVQVPMGVIRGGQSKGLTVYKAAWEELKREQHERDVRAKIVERQTGSRPDGSFLKDTHHHAVDLLLERQESKQRTTERDLQDLPIPLSVLNDLLTYTVQVGSDKNATVLSWVRPNIDRKDREVEIEKINKEVPVSAYHRVKLTSYYHAFTQLNEESLNRAEGALRNLYELRRIGRFFCAGDVKPKVYKKDFEALKKALKEQPEIWKEVQSYVAKAQEVVAQIDKTSKAPKAASIAASIRGLLSLYNPALRLEQLLLSVGIEDAKGAYASTVLAIDALAQMCENMFLASSTSMDEVFNEMSEKEALRRNTAPNDYDKRIPYIEKITQEQLDSVLTIAMEPGEKKIYPVTQLSARVDPSGVGKATGADPAEHFYVVDNVGRYVFFKAEREYSPAFDFVDAMNPYTYRAFKALEAGLAIDVVHEASVRDGTPISRELLGRFFANGMITGMLSRGMKVDTRVLDADTEVDPRMIIRLYARHKAYNPFFTWQTVEGPEAVAQTGAPSDATPENYVPCVSKADANRLRGYRAIRDLIYQYKTVFGKIRSVIEKALTYNYKDLPPLTGSEDQLDEIVRDYIRAGEYTFTLQNRWQEERHSRRYTDVRLAGTDLSNLMNAIFKQEVPQLLEDTGFDLFQVSRDPARKPAESERLQTVRKKRRARIRTADKPERGDDLFQQDAFKPYVQHVLEKIVKDEPVDMAVWERWEDKGRIDYSRHKTNAWPTLAKTALNFFARAAGLYVQDDVQKEQINTYLYGQYKRALQDDLYNPIAGALPFVASSFDQDNLVPALKEDPRYAKAVQEQFNQLQTEVRIQTCPISVRVERNIGYIPSARESSRKTVLFLVRDSDVDVKDGKGNPYLEQVAIFLKARGYDLAAPERGPEREEPRRLPGRDPEVGGRDEFVFNAGYLRRLNLEAKPMNPRDLNTAGKNEIIHYLKPYALIIDTGNFLHRDIIEAANAYGIAVARLDNLSNRQQRAKIDEIILALTERVRFEAALGQPLYVLVEAAQRLVDRLLEQDIDFTEDQQSALVEMSRDPNLLREVIYTVGDFRVPDPTGGRLKDLISQQFDAIRSRRTSKAQLAEEVDAAEKVYKEVSALIDPATETLDRSHPGSGELTNSLLSGDTDTRAAKEAERLFKLLSQMGQGDSQAFVKYARSAKVEGQVIPFTFLPKTGISEETFAKMDEIEVMSGLIERGLIAWRDTVQVGQKAEVALRFFRFLWLAQFYYYLNGYKAAGSLLNRTDNLRYPVRDMRTIKLEYERSKKNKFTLDLVLSDLKQRTAEVYLGKNLLNRVDRLNAYALSYLTAKEEQYQKARREGRGFKPLTEADREELTSLLNTGMDFTDAFLQVLLRQEKVVLSPEERREVRDKMQTRMLEIPGQRGGRYRVEQAAEDVRTILSELRLSADSDFLTQPIGVNQLVEGARLLGDTVTPDQMRVLLSARAKQQDTPGFGRTGKILVFKTYNPILFELTRLFYGDIREGQRNLMRSARLVEAIDNAGCYGMTLKLSSEAAAYASLVTASGFDVYQPEILRTHILGGANARKEWTYPSFAYSILRNERWDGAERQTRGRKAKAEFGEYANIGGIWPLGVEPEGLGEFLTNLFTAYDDQGNPLDQVFPEPQLRFMRENFEKDLIFVESLENAYFRPDDELKYKLKTLKVYLENYKGNYLSASEPYLEVAKRGGADFEYRTRLREFTLSLIPKVQASDEILDLFEAAAVARWYKDSRRKDPAKWKRYQRENASILARLRQLQDLISAEGVDYQRQQDLLFERTKLEAQLPAPYSPKVIQAMWGTEGHPGLKSARTVASPGRLPPLFGDVKKTQQALYKTSVWQMMPAQREFYGGRREEITSLQKEVEGFIDPEEREDLERTAREARLSEESRREIERDRLLRAFGQSFETLDTPDTFEVEVYNNPRSDRRARQVRNPFRGRQYR